MKRVFVSGCYDIIHAGHVQFFEEARTLIMDLERNLGIR